MPCFHFKEEEGNHNNNNNNNSNSFKVNVINLWFRRKTARSVAILVLCRGGFEKELFLSLVVVLQCGRKHCPGNYKSSVNTCCCMYYCKDIFNLLMSCC